MSQRSPTELVRRAFDAFGQRDVETLIEISDPGISIASVTGVIAGREKPYTGTEALVDYMRDVESIWDEIELVPQEFHELDDDRVLVFGRVRARRRNSRIDTPNAWLWELRGDKVAAVHVYAEPTADARWLFKKDPPEN